MMDLARLLLSAGAALMLAGAVVWAAGHFGSGWHLPGDMVVRRGRWTAYFPLGTSLALSIVLSLLATVVTRLWRR